MNWLMERKGVRPPLSVNVYILRESVHTIDTACAFRGKVDDALCLEVVCVDVYMIYYKLGWVELDERKNIGWCGMRDLLAAVDLLTDVV